MFCEQCGEKLEASQQFCSRCGRQVVGIVPGYPRRSRVQEHVRLLAIFWFALSALNVLGGIILVTIANTLFRHYHGLGDPESATGFLHPLLTFVGLFVLAKAAFGLATGWGLLQREPWARVMALVLAFLSLMNIPFGTALGIYTLWVLLPAQAEEDYEKYLRAAA